MSVLDCYLLPFCCFGNVWRTQKTELIKNIERLTFWAGDNEKLHFAKQELLSQINNLDISISGKGFFVIDRQFLAGVSHKSFVIEFSCRLYNTHFFRASNAYRPK